MSVAAGPNSPMLTVEIDFTNDPTNPARVYTDVSADVRTLTCTRDGRDNELSRTTPGQLSMVLDNRAGKYDSTNTASLYYPGVKRKRWVRVSATWLGVTYRRWTGLIATIEQDWPAGGYDATVTITATSAMTVLSLFDLVGLSFGSQTTGARVAAVLTAAAITGSTVDTGLVTIVAAGPFAAESDALSHLLEVEASENGLLFTDGDGTIHFQDRHYRLLNSTTSLGTIGDAFGEIAYDTGLLNLDDSDLWNSVTVTPSGGAPQTFQDATSIASYFQRQLDVSILSSDTGEALSTAQYLVGRYKDTAPRIPTVNVIGAANPLKWPLILGAVNSNRFTWKRRASAHTISQDVFVEKVTDTVTPAQDWRVSFQMSPAVDQVGWLAGTTGFSEAGVTTRAVY